MRSSGPTLRAAITTGVAWLLAVAVSPVLVRASVPVANCDQRVLDAKKWAEENVECFPIDTRLEFLVVPEAFQPYVYGTLSPEVRSSLWQDKLDTVVASGTLTDAQVEMLGALRDYVSPALFHDRRGQDLNSIKRWTTEAASIFERSDLMGICGNLGEFTGRESVRGPVTSGASEQRTGTTATHTAATPTANCDCHVKDANYCPFTYWCVSGGCAYLPSGCGTLWLFPCDGHCNVSRRGPAVGSVGIVLLILATGAFGSVVLSRRLA